MNLKLQSFLHQKGKYKEKAFKIVPFPIDKKNYAKICSIPVSFNFSTIFFNYINKCLTSFKKLIIINHLLE